MQEKLENFIAQIVCKIQKADHYCIETKIIKITQKCAQLHNFEIQSFHFIGVCTETKVWIL